MAIDYQKFQGILPYASELVGVYQPLLGWKSKHTFNRFRREYTQILDGAIRDLAALGPPRKDILRQPRPIGPDDLRPGNLPGLLDGRVGGRALGAVVAFTERNGRAPSGSQEWGEVLASADLPGAIAEAASLENAAGRTDGRAAAPLAMKKMSTKHEAATAGALYYLAKQAPHTLQFVVDASVYSYALAWATDPLAHFDPAVQQAVLSPLGLLDVYREYFFEFETFLGPPVGHVWVSPGGLVELYEVHTRRTRQERETEIATEQTAKSETETSEEDEISTAVSEENGRNINLGISASGGVDFGVAEASASASLGLEFNHKVSQETAHKHTRRQSEKLSNEIRRSFKTTFRTTVETEDIASRRHVLQNTTDKLINYELRRKMRQVGIQLQHIATQLCWQSYVDEPGEALGIASLVHAAASPELSALQPPDAPVVQPTKKEQYVFEFPFEPKDDEAADDGEDEDYDHGHDVEEDPGEGLIVWKKTIPVPPPAAGYVLAGNPTIVNAIGTTPDEDPVVVQAECAKLGDDSFECRLNWVNFNDNAAIRFTVDLIWDPPPVSAEAKLAYAEKQKQYEEASKQEYQQAYLKTVRERIKLSSEVQARPEHDLREEERTVIYRRLIQRLTGVSLDIEPHLLAELIRAIFDVEKMLYFVAGEWWKPRTHHPQNLGDMAPLTPEDQVSWGGADALGRPNYLITEDSRPARLGSSLGWLIQLDGDSHRNAFLNSPWVKAVIPIRPGKELAAINWLKLAHVEGADNLDATYAGPEPELSGKTIEQVLHLLATKVQQIGDDMTNTLATEKVFEQGFDPLEGGFRVADPFEVFDQWIEILPTDQVVAVEYPASPAPP